MLTVGSLFAGIGGFDLGLERAGMRVLWQSEIDPYASAVLRKHWPNVPNHGDIRLIRAGTVERPDVICGGFPCQPFSHAGKRASKDDDRHLWPEMCRVIDELRPAWVIGENVAGIISMELDQVLSDLETAGYATRTFVIPAVAVDAPHRRDRVWIIAHDLCERSRSTESRQQQGERAEIIDPGRAGELAALRDRDRDRDRESACAVNAEASGLSFDYYEWPEYFAVLGNGNGDSEYHGAIVAHADEHGPQGRDGGIVRERASECVAGASRSPVMAIPGRISSRRGSTSIEKDSGRALCQPSGSSKWLPEPGVGRVAHGIPARVDRLRCLGNAIVPQIAEILGRAILESEAAR